ncbi:DUF2795 domain-containing protein [Longispora urticae]
MTSVTRAEIADHLADAFDLGRLTRAEILVAAHTTGARTEVLETLAALPERTFSTPRDLWPHLASVPIGA